MATRKEIQEKMEERKQIVEKLCKEGKKTKEIAQIVGVSVPTISRTIKILVNEGKVKALKKAGREKGKLKKLEPRRQKVREYCNQGKSTREIAQIFHISVATVNRDINLLIDRGEIKQPRWYKKEKGLLKSIENFKGQEESIKNFETYINNCKNRLENNILEKEEMPLIKEVVMLMDDYKATMFYLKLCIYFNQYNEAERFARCQADNEKFTEKERQKIEKIMQEVIKIKKKKVAVIILKTGGTVEKAMRHSGLGEREVLALNLEMIKRDRAEAKKEPPEAR